VNTRLIARYLLGEVLSLLGLGVVLFWSAGRVDWWPAWAAIGVLTAWSAAMGIVILRLHPDLLVERLGRTKGALTWDTILLMSISLVSLARYILAGLDQRFGWSGGFSLQAQIIALILCALGYALFVWAVAFNGFFSKIARIQTDRGHTVESGGPYRFIRHPAYLGGILFELAVSVLFASWWALIASALSAGLLILRTALEDRTLRAGLIGYEQYASKVRYRLFPGIW